MLIFCSYYISLEKTYFLGNVATLLMASQHRYVLRTNHTAMLEFLNCAGARWVVTSHLQYYLFSVNSSLIAILVRALAGC